MADELKTLKDLGGHISKGEFCQCETYSHNNWLVNMLELKAEAVKWVKKKLKENPSINIERIYYKDGETHVDWFLKNEDRNDFYISGFIFSKINFFNITEEDLK